MASLTVYGASDDLIEVEGLLDEEFYALKFGEDDEDDGGYLAFSDGTVLKAIYDSDGFWRINRMATGKATYEKTEGTNEDTDYSDRVTLSGIVIHWVVLGPKFYDKVSVFDND